MQTFNQKTVPCVHTQGVFVQLLLPFLCIFYSFRVILQLLDEYLGTPTENRTRN